MRYLKYYLHPMMLDISDRERAYLAWHIRRLKKLIPRGIYSRLKEPVSTNLVHLEAAFNTHRCLDVHFSPSLSFSLSLSLHHSLLLIYFSSSSLSLWPFNHYLISTWVHLFLNFCCYEPSFLLHSHCLLLLPLGLYVTCFTFHFCVFFYLWPSL